MSFTSVTALATHLSGCSGRFKLKTSTSTYWRWVGKIKPKAGFSSGRLTILKELAALSPETRRKNTNYPKMKGRKRPLQYVIILLMEVLRALNNIYLFTASLLIYSTDDEEEEKEEEQEEEEGQ